MLEFKASRVGHRTSRARRCLAIGVVGVLSILSVLFAGSSLRTATFEPISSARAQQLDHSNHAPITNPEPLVDGSVQPELIPDDVAIRALMQTLRVPADPDAADLKQLRSRLDRVSLNSADKQVVVRELGIFDARAQEQEIRIEAARPRSSLPVESAAVARYVEEQTKLRLLMVEHYEQLLASLSPAGEVEMREHLSHIKSRIKIYPRPDMFADID